jgi:hypothetical protein
MCSYRVLAGALMTALIVGHATESGAAVARQQSLMAPDARVRGVSARVVAIINKAAAQSETFRGLVDQINHTDGIVYVAEGDCGSGVRACLLLTMTMMGDAAVRAGNAVRDELLESAACAR